VGVVDEVEGDDGGVARDLLAVARGGRLRTVDRREGDVERRGVVAQLLGQVFAVDFAVQIGADRRDLLGKRGELRCEMTATHSDSDGDGDGDGERRRRIVMLAGTYRQWGHQDA
jgi:hypothetical protein